jgi:hypothetical protein
MQPHKLAFRKHEFKLTNCVVDLAFSFSASARLTQHSASRACSSNSAFITAQSQHSVPFLRCRSQYFWHSARTPTMLSNNVGRITCKSFTKSSIILRFCRSMKLNLKSSRGERLSFSAPTLAEMIRLDYICPVPLAKSFLFRHGR